MLKTVLNGGYSLAKAVTGSILGTANIIGSKFCQMAKSPRFSIMLVFCLVASISAFAGSEAGTQAMTQVTADIRKYIPLVKNLCYVLAAIFAIVGAISVYIAMNNDEQDVKKKIMMTVGACIFMIAAAESLPLFFGESSAAAN